jgi:hypothetical protein
MLPDENPSRIPQRRRETRNYSGASSRPREAFQVRRSGVPREPRRRKVRRQVTIVKPGHQLAIVAVVLCLILAVAGGLWWLGRDRGEDRSAETRPSRPAKTAPALRPVWRGPIPAEVAEKFTTATTHAERMKWVREPDEVGPAMKAFFRDGPGSSEEFVQALPMSPSGGGELLFENFQVVFANGQSRVLCVSVDPEGAKVDFKAYARLGSHEWEDLLSGAVEAADEMRVVLERGGYYIHRFADESRWLHFKASTPDLQESMDFYVERDSAAGRELARQGDYQMQATVSLRAEGDSAKYRQFEITALKSTGWVVVDE